MTLLENPSLHHQKLSCRTVQLDYDIPRKLAESFRKFEHVFLESKGLSPFRGCKYAINLQPRTGLISVWSYRYPHAHEEIMETSVKEMLATGAIRPSQSPYSSHVLLVKKKDNMVLLC